MTAGVFSKPWMVALVVIGIAVSSQSIFGGELSRSYKRILVTEPSIDRARLRTTRQEIREEIVRSRLRPQLNALVSENLIQENSLNASESFQGSRFELSVSQAILNLETIARLEREERLTDASRSAFIAAKDEVALQLLQRFFQVQQATSRLISIESLVRTLELRREQAEARAQAGQGSRLEIFQFDSRLAERRANLATAKAELEVAKASLLELDPVFQLKDQVVEFSVDFEWPEIDSIEDLVHRASVDNPRSTELQLLFNAEQLGLTAIERRRFPVIQFGASFGERDVNSDNSSATKTQTAVYGVSFTWPLYSGGRTSAEIDEQGAVLQSIRTDQASLKRRLAREISEAVSNYRSGQDRVNAQSAYLNAQMVVERVLLAAYQQGAVSQAEYFDALDTLASARIARDSAIFSTALSWLRLQVISGAFVADNLDWIDGLLMNVPE